MIKITNDTSTLNGSLLEMKDQLIYELGEQGVTASYDSSTGLLGLIHKISEIVPVTPTLTLTSNKNVLSYYDSETATLTATHSRGAGKTVEIYDAIDGTKIGDATDNGDGTYSYTYSSSGVGDISMTATSGTLESNAVTIEDCLYYNADQYTNTNAQIPITLPSNFMIDYQVKQTSTGYYGAYMQVGESNKGVLAGQQYSNKASIFDWGLSTTDRADVDFTFENNQWYHYKFTYDDGVFRLNIDNVPIVSYTKIYTTRDYVGVRTESNGIIKEVKIKPLPPSIDLTASSSILSYYDSETTTLTATHSAGSGRLVEIYDAVSGTKIGNATDNQDGTYSYTYNSTGVGDIQIIAKSGASESNIVTIEDCVLFDTMITDSGHWSLPSGSTMSISRDLNGTTLSAQKCWDFLNCDYVFDLPFEIEFEFVSSSGWQSTGYGISNSTHYELLWYDTNIKGYRYVNANGNETYNKTLSAPVEGDKFKVVLTSTTETWYKNNDVIVSLSYSPTQVDPVFYFALCGSGAVEKIKNVKIKAI